MVDSKSLVAIAFNVTTMFKRGILKFQLVKLYHFSKKEESFFPQVLLS